MRIDTNGVTLDVTVRGDGPSVLLLHGWPDDRDVWRAQIPALLDAGYRVIAPDLRGCGESDRPTDVVDYGTASLVADVVGVLDALRVERTHVVGHDWGAGLAWVLGSVLPQRVDHLACLSVGHPTAFHRSDMAQVQKSWYMLLFQFEGIAEEWLSGNEFRNFTEWTSHPDVDRVVARLRRPQHLTGGLNWYRANLGAQRLVAQVLELPPVTVPTLGVWSSNDFAVLERQMTDSAEFVTGPWRYERLDGVGHWMTIESPQVINELLIEFLSTSDTSDPLPQ